MDYKAPTGPPPEWNQQQPQQAHMNYQQQDRGMFSGGQQGGYYQQGPPQGGYYQGPPPQGYYPQQQPVYVQQQRGLNSDGCLMGCLAALCACCVLDAIF